MKSKSIWLAAAVVWAFAEATVFFIVPDIVLTAAVIIVGAAAAFRFAIAAAAAAACGGLLMWIWGASDSDAARTFLLGVPLIGEDLLLRVWVETKGNWPFHLAKGAVTGAPYKIYAVEAGAGGVNPFYFFMASFFARLARFALAIGLTAAGLALARRLGLAGLAPLGLAAVWAGIYWQYFLTRIAA